MGVPSLKCRRHGRALRAARVPTALAGAIESRVARLPMASALPSRKRDFGTSRRQLADQRNVRARSISGSPLPQKGAFLVPNGDRKRARVRGNRGRLLHQLHAGDGFEVLVVALLAVGLRNAVVMEVIQDLCGIPGRTFVV